MPKQRLQVYKMYTTEAYSLTQEGKEKNQKASLALT